MGSRLTTHLYFCGGGNNKLFTATIKSADSEDMKLKKARILDIKFTHLKRNESSVLFIHKGQKTVDLNHNVAVVSTRGSWV